MCFRELGSKMATINLELIKESKLKYLIDETNERSTS